VSPAFAVVALGALIEKVTIAVAVGEGEAVGEIFFEDALLDEESVNPVVVEDSPTIL
jgi:hypothetical protein